MFTWVQVDAERQRLNVFRMEMMGATVHAVETGTPNTQGCVRTQPSVLDERFGSLLYVLAWLLTLTPIRRLLASFKR